MDQFSCMMSEIVRLRIENAEMRKNNLVKENIMKGEPPHYRSKAIMGDQDVPDPGVQKQDTQTMFSDDKGFEQYSSPDYGSGTRAEKAGFISPDTSDVTDETQKKKREERILAQKRLHKFSGYPIGIGDKYF